MARSPRAVFLTRSAPEKRRLFARLSSRTTIIFGLLLEHKTARIKFDARNSSADIGATMRPRFPKEGESASDVSESSLDEHLQKPFEPAIVSNLLGNAPFVINTGEDSSEARNAGSSAAPPAPLPLPRTREKSSGHLSDTERAERISNYVVPFAAER